MKTFLSLFSLFSVAGLLFFTGCASEGQGGTSDTMESSQEQYDAYYDNDTMSYDTKINNGDYWARAYH